MSTLNAGITVSGDDKSSFYEKEYNMEDDADYDESEMEIRYGRMRDPTELNE